MNLLEQALSLFFPPQLPGRVRPDSWPDPSDPFLAPLHHREHGIGTPKPKPYRDGIERYTREAQCS